MPVNDTTTNQGYQKPNIANQLSDDVGRLRSALDSIDTDMAARLAKAGGVMTGALGVTAGTAGAPSVYFTGDPNTGLYSPGADQVAISTGGTGRLFVDANGNIGLKTSSPFSYGVAAANLANLQVEASQFGVITLGSTTGGADQKYWRMIGRGSFLEIQSMNDAGTAESSAIRINKGVAAQTSSVQFYAEDSLRATIAASSSVVGGAAVATATPTSFTLDNTYKSTSPSWDTLKFNLFKSTTEAYGFGVGNASDLHYFAGGAATGAHAFYTSRTERLRITSDGKVGVGTTAPLALLHTSASGAGGAEAPILFQNFSTSAGTSVALYLSPSSGSLTTGSIRAAAIKGIAGTSNVVSLGFFTNSSGADPLERARIDSSGRLLVGTSAGRTIGTGNFQIQAEGTGAESGISLTRNASSSASSNLRFVKTRGAAAGSTTIVQSGDDLGVLGWWGTDGAGAVEAVNIKAVVDGIPGTNDMPGRLVFSTTADGASSPTERLRITSAGVLQIADAGDIAVGTTTGTKIGTATTQKLGFFNKTPVVQPTAVADATDAASVITQLNALLSRMRDLGLIAT